MYTATMLYHFKEASFDLACEIWKSHVLQAASNQEGFVRMQFLVASPEALAIGTWQEKVHAEAFMKTGVFTRLMFELETLCAASPQPKVWDLHFFESRQD